jgi:uncharacterized protein (UPF0254 family)
MPFLPPTFGGVTDAVFWSGGIAVLTKHNRVIVTTDIEAVMRDKAIDLVSR